MKQSFARQHSRHRNHTPSVIHLPPPAPPITAKRPVETAAEAAIALPPTPEPLVVERTEVGASQTPVSNRQARRKALRAEAKALRRLGEPPEPAVRVASAAEPVAERPVEAASVDPTIAQATPVTTDFIPPEADRPLPRSRSLVTARPRGVALLSHRLRKLFGFAGGVRAPDEGAIAAQLRTLRTELARLQRSVDHMLEGTA
jgi:hypothetical protein